MGQTSRLKPEYFGTLHRWRPDPWSNRYPALVPDLASRLAEALSLPYVPVVEKVRDNAPQKAQQNRFHQCRNLDGAFAIDGRIPEGGVLLVDDIVDSKWTLTVVAALLRRLGCPAVWPFALASANQGG